MTASIESNLELVLTRDIPIAPEKLFQTWHERLPEWWAPRPLTTPVCEVDFRPGGAFKTLMRDPEGTEYPASGVFLDIQKGSRIVLTDAYDAEWKPNPAIFFTAVITFDPLPDGGTRYTARALHWTEENCNKHKEMGFYEGWAQCLDQLIEVAKQN